MIASLLGFAPPACGETTPANTAPRPNILIIYSDDVGFGDVSCYGTGDIQTPNIDDLARTGRRFTRAYASAATCTPSRYSLLTGRYAFRNPRAHVLDGDAPLLIEPGSLTLPSHLREAGYRTAAIGKWHLGLGAGDIDWNAEVAPGPLEIGFDESYLLPATNDRVPCVYLDGHSVENLDKSDRIEISYEKRIGERPTGKERPDLLRYQADAQHSGTIINGISRIGFMAGGHAAEWVDEQLTDRFTTRAIQSITRWEHEDADRPWFLYFNSQQVHEPRLPNPRFLGRSGHGVRGDGMLELDWCVGELVATLDRLGIRNETLIVFSSDNGPVLTDGYADGSLEANGGHSPAGPFRGGKYTLWEGGTRLPFIVNWPGHVQPGVSDALISQLDLLASAATLSGRPIPSEAEASLDSRDVLPALLGQTDVARRILLTQGAGGVAIHVGDWKYIPAGSRTPAWVIHKHGGQGNPLSSPPHGEVPSLFELASDPGETRDVLADHPDIADQLRSDLEQLMADPCSLEIMQAGRP
ncbi:MAG: arylsulfatase [Phycisphaeraceae bacterium]|nr:MAG: arylsulfatase [Phycisphaeraceae bacterium]